MTILTTPSLLKKPFLDSPQNVNVENGDDQKVVFMEPGTSEPPRGSGAAVLCMAIIALLVASVGCLFGLELYREYMQTNTYRRYQGFCSIPVEMDDDQTHLRVMHWSSSGENKITFDPDERSSSDDDRSIREEIDIGDELEKISVFNIDGRQTSFIHDFNANVSGIIDDDRCFLMDLDLELVMPPHAFVMNIEGNGEFDVSRVRDAMRAILPPLFSVAASRHIDERCQGKPIYQLEKEMGFQPVKYRDDEDEDADRKLVRKRSVDGGRADFTHFAGHRVQEITITNLPTLQALEEENKKK